MSLVFEKCMKLGNLQCKSNFNRNEVLLLMIENIKTIQIGKFCKGEKNALKKYLHFFFCTLSPLVGQVFPKSIEKYCLLSIPIPLKCHFSIIPKPHELGTWNFEKIITIHYVSCVLCHMSDDTCHLSHVTCHIFLYKGGKLFCWGSAINEGYPV